MRAESFMWSNLDVFLHVEMITSMFRVSNEGSTVCFCCQRCLESIVSLWGSFLGLQQDRMTGWKGFHRGTNKNCSGFIKAYANACVSIHLNSCNVFGFWK